MLLTSDVIMFIYPTCCAPFSLGHKEVFDTVSCGSSPTRKKEQLQPMATKKASSKGGTKKTASKSSAKGGAKKSATKKSSAKKGTSKKSSK